MRRIGSLVPTIVATLPFFVAAIAFAQPNLPPPPPPSLQERTPVETLATPVRHPAPSPPPSAGPSSTQPTPSASGHHPAPPPVPPLHPALPPRGHARAELTPDQPERRVVVVSWSPVPLVWGRLGLEGEIEMARHHALFGSLNALIFPVDRGAAGSTLSAGFGFAGVTSDGLGVEVGYHFWFDARHALWGAYLGPSLLLGTTSQAAVGDGAAWQGYWGGAIDAGWQEVFPVGLTVAAGGGLALAHMANVTALYPRLVARAGWAF